ncbi:MAG: chemotaxis protein CheW [Nanobdellota archaeon]
MVNEQSGKKEAGGPQKDYSERQMVIFNLGNEEFCVDINEVNSIIKMTPITKIPNSQSFIEGVINLRGRIIVVIDLAKKIGLPSKERGKDTRIIVIETNDSMVGMIVDHSREAIRVSEEQIEPAPPLITQKISSDYLDGVAIVPSKNGESDNNQDSGNSVQSNDRLLILLDLAKVLSADEVSSVQKVQSSASPSAASASQPKAESSDNATQNSSEKQGEQEQSGAESAEKSSESGEQEPKKEGGASPSADAGGEQAQQKTQDQNTNVQ